MNSWDTYPKYYIQRNKQENVDLWCLNVNALMMHPSSMYDMLLTISSQNATCDNHSLKPTSEIFKYDDTLGFLTEQEMNLMTKDN